MYFNIIIVGLFDIAWLIPDQVLIGTQPTAKMLRVINLVDDEVTSICQGKLACSDLAERSGIKIVHVHQERTEDQVKPNLLI